VTQQDGGEGQKRQGCVCKKDVGMKVYLRSTIVSGGGGKLGVLGAERGEGG